MKSQWLKQSIHKELDHTREAWASRTGEVPVELAVEGGIVQGEPQSLTAEAQQEAQKVYEAVQGSMVDDEGLAHPEAQAAAEVMAEEQWPMDQYEPWGEEYVEAPVFWDDGIP